MNRYPVWKYAILVIALLVGLIYTLPNLYGEAPAVQVSSGKATVKIDAAMATRIEWRERDLTIKVIGRLGHGGQERVLGLPHDVDVASGQTWAETQRGGSRTT